MHIKCSFCKDLCTLNLTYRKFSKKHNGKVLLIASLQSGERKRRNEMKFWKSEKKKDTFCHFERCYKRLIDSFK